MRIKACESLQCSENLPIMAYTEPLSGDLVLMQNVWGRVGGIHEVHLSREQQKDLLALLLERAEPVDAGDE